MTPDTTQISEDVGYALIETHLGLKKRHDHTVIDSKTGRYTDSARYFGLMDAAYQAGHAAAAAETAAAVAKERERCASIADQYARIGVLRSLEATYKANTAKEIAAAIRAGESNDA